MTNNIENDHFMKFQNLSKFLVNNDIIENFTLIDIGCSQGIDQKWNIFRPKLSALAFDPVKSEIEKLNKNESDQKIKYIPALIGLPEDHPFVKKLDKDENGYIYNHNNPLDRFSSSKAFNILIKKQNNEEKNKYHAELNDWKKEDNIKKITKVDYHIEKENIKSVDFIKVDIDGPDILAIHSFEKTLKKIMYWELC